MTKKHQPDSFENIEGALSKTERYIEENQKSLTVIVVAIFLLFGGYYGYKKFILKPKEETARAEFFMAEQYFARDSFNLAINGDMANFPGFEEIIDDYGITKSANLAHYYKGISNMRLGNYDQAIDDLKDFDGSDKFVAAISIGAIGDCYAELDDMDKAASFYEKAVNYNENEFTTPIYLFKLGQVYEEIGKLKKAHDAYKEIELEYPTSNESRNIKKYITQVKFKMNE